ncbi:ester cyclase [Dactylosporangium roseum]|nr:ester cyclase [Dactylosporangium roseum]
MLGACIEDGCDGELSATTGVHTGPFAGHPPTGRRVSERAHVFYRLVDHRVVEVWPMVDRAGLLQQFAAR